MSNNPKSSNVKCDNNCDRCYMYEDCPHFEDHKPKRDSENLIKRLRKLLRKRDKVVKTYPFK